MRSVGRPRFLTNKRKAAIIEYWVTHQDILMKDIAKQFNIPPSTLSWILTKDYLSKHYYTAFGVATITLQSKINEPELITI